MRGEEKEKREIPEAALVKELEHFLQKKLSGLTLLSAFM